MRKEVHGAPTTFATAGFLAEELTHYFAGGYTGAKGMNVIAIGTAKPIVLAFHCTDYTCANGFLAVVEVNKTEHLPAVIHFGTFVFEPSSQSHVSEKV